ncbi:hypothetical protein [Fictibacillus norfolkensis]|nr:hypothetical protein [Fictibacillus norfolkensis]
MCWILVMLCEVGQWRRWDWTDYWLKWTDYVGDWTDYTANRTD